ncbi:MAG: two-component sensor histidine kinase, partial [Propionibacteriaceae bacterium]|nr:two-component sensor histidine kinase [Propionibacteriaceae bacterium]
MPAELWNAMSLRARFTLVAAVVVGFALVGASAGLLATLRHSLVENQDQLSLGQARQVAEQASNGTLPTTLALSDDSVAQVVDSDGSVLAATAGVAGHGPI